MRGLGIRFAAALVLVLATYNPEGQSFFHWVVGSWETMTPPKALAGVVLTIGWVVAFTTAWRALGVIGTGLLAALVATLLWTIMDFAGVEASSRAITYGVLVGIAFVLAVATSWKTLRASFRSEEAG
ncbi:MAG: DUF6524 family protein [Myxococcota bacterium]